LAGDTRRSTQSLIDNDADEVGSLKEDLGEAIIGKPVPLWTDLFIYLS
jgi:hypothetical protein